MDHPNQARALSEKTNDEIVSALSWRIATEPKLYQELAANPYSYHSIKIITERFPEASIVNIIHAVILAEPVGRFDRNFKLLGSAEQANEIVKQNVIFQQMHIRMKQFCETHTKDLEHLPKDIVYSSLSNFVFETVDIKEIDQRYSQDQRRDLKLAIVNFIESMPGHGSNPGQKYNNNSSTNSKKKSPRGRLLKTTIAVLCIIPILFIIYISLQIMPRSQQAPKKAIASGAQGAIEAFPVRLMIPAINVDAPVEYMGLTTNGEMEVPTSITGVGWFKFGPRPGEKGSAVIAGHFDGRTGEAGVFNDLYKLKVGDKLYIKDGSGKFIGFVVRELRTYDPGYADDVFGRTDIAHLNLVTCDGVWNRSKKSYSKRLVVMTDIAN